MEDPVPLTITLEPLDDHLIVETVDEDVETRTGLIIPQSAEAGCRTGIVTAVGAEPIFKATRILSASASRTYTKRSPLATIRSLLASTRRVPSNLTGKSSVVDVYPIR